jgi:hypothetical protein
MLMAVHGAVGALIGENVTNPLLAFGLAFGSHFLLDVIPHGDHHHVQSFKTEKKLKKMINLIILDMIVGVLFLFIISPKPKRSALTCGRSRPGLPAAFCRIYWLRFII